MRVLGIDPGSRATGYGVVDALDRRLVHVESGVIRLADSSLPPRLKIIVSQLGRIVDQFQPEIVAVERVFMAKNPQSALTLGHARGAAICAAVSRDLHVCEYTALQIKQAVVGHGKAAKEQVAHMVRVLLSLSESPRSDAADALACAICHLHTEELQRKLRRASPDTIS